jgi:hypothetical protein
MALKLPKAYETEIYITEGGYVAIKQPDERGDEDQTILLTATQLELVIAELEARLKHRAEWESLGVEREEEKTSEPEAESESMLADDDRPTSPPH